MHCAVQEIKAIRPDIPHIKLIIALIKLTTTAPKSNESLDQQIENFMNNILTSPVNENGSTN